MDFEGQEWVLPEEPQPKVEKVCTLVHAPAVRPCRPCLQPVTPLVFLLACMRLHAYNGAGTVLYHMWARTAALGCV
jgi:hypothetical protein